MWSPLTNRVTVLLRIHPLYALYTHRNIFVCIPRAHITLCTFNVGAVLLQYCPLQLLHIDEQQSPSFFQLHVMLLQPWDLHPYDTMFSKLSGAKEMSVSTGARVLSWDRQSHSVADRGLLIHCWTANSIQHECFFAAALVGVTFASWNDEVWELRTIARLYAM